MILDTNAIYAPFEDDEALHAHIAAEGRLHRPLIAIGKFRLAAEQPSPPSAGKGAIEIACRLREPYAAAAG